MHKPLEDHQHIVPPAFDVSPVEHLDLKAIWAECGQVRQILWAEDILDHVDTALDEAVFEGQERSCLILGLVASVVDDDVEPAVTDTSRSTGLVPSQACMEMRGDSMPTVYTRSSPTMSPLAKYASQSFSEPPWNTPSLQQVGMSLHGREQPIVHLQVGVGRAFVRVKLPRFIEFDLGEHGRVVRQTKGRYTISLQLDIHGLSPEGAVVRVLDPHIAKPEENRPKPKRRKR